MSVVEAIYDDYAKANFTNYELRREDLNQLASFARQFSNVQEFLSQLALISNVDAEPRRMRRRTMKLLTFRRCIRRKAWNFTPFS